MVFGYLSVQQREAQASKTQKPDRSEIGENLIASAIPGLFESRSATDNVSPKNGHAETAENSSGADTSTKEEQRKRKKEEKRLKKALEEQQRAAHAGSNGTNEPFDYSTAPSVLNAPRTEDLGSQHVLNPYKKALDAPKGLSKRQKETAGKSATWSS